MIKSNGFVIKKCIDNSQNVKYISFTVNELNEGFLLKKYNSYINFFGKVLPYNDSVDNLFEEVKIKYGFKNILLSGRIIETANLNDKINKAFKYLSEQHSFSKFSEIDGDYIIAIESEDYFFAYCGQCSQYPAFWSFNGNCLKFSNYHKFVSDKINRDLLIPFCCGYKINFFDDLLILKPNCALIVDYVAKKSKVITKVISPSNPFNGKETLPEISELIYSALLRSVENYSKDYDKIALLLSGGIDSEAIARCLYDLNKNFKCYTLSCPKEDASEFRFSKKTGNMLGISVSEIRPDLYHESLIIPKNKTTFPIGHAVSNWSKILFEQAIQDDAKIIFTGHMAEILDGDKSEGSFSKHQELTQKSYNFRTNICNRLALKYCIPRPFYNYINSFDIFTPEAIKKIKVTFSNTKLFDTFLLDMYSYKINGMDLYNLSYEAPFLSKELFDIAYFLPSWAISGYHGGVRISKIALRYSMVDKLPMEVVGHCYPGNIDYCLQTTLCSNYDDVVKFFTNEKLLIREGIVDLLKIKSLRGNNKLIMKNAVPLQLVCNIQQWLDYQNN